MSFQLQIRQLLLSITFIGVISTWCSGQNSSIGLEEAIRIASANHAGIERDRLSVEQQTQLAGSGLLMQPAQLFITGEEFDFDGQSGVQSLNIQQNFYLPKVAKAQRAYYQQSALLAERQLAITEQELKRQVQQAYYRLQFAKQEQALAAENLTLYNNFLEVATAQLVSGETGIIPQLAARSRIGQAQLEQEHADEKYQIAFALFNKWLQSDTLYDVEGILPLDPRALIDTSLLSNPHLQFIQARKELAVARVETQKVQLLPQINSGLKLQRAFGDFPLFGYQIGINVPLFRQAYKTHIEAAKVGVKVQEAAFHTEWQELDMRISELYYRIEHQLHILEYLEEELRPIVDEQCAVNLQAYQEGELGYLEYMDSLEQVMEVKQQYLNALYQFNALQVELDYLLGN
jgi:cobalt-zinc-cadmium resistance protein CzcA